MNPNNSPWLHQLKLTRPIEAMSSDITADVVVVGAGIAGVMTSYFLLKYTERRVVLIEGSRVAHGATGHNGGQIVSDFEKGFGELVREFGLEKAADAEKAVRSSWILLEEIYQSAVLETPLSSFMGYNGYRSIEHVIEEVRSNVLRKDAGLQTYPIYIASEAEHEKIPAEYRYFYELIPQKDILSLLETSDESYIAATSTKKGCINSAMLSEEMVGYFLANFKDRFRLFEHSSVRLLELNKDDAKLFITTNKKNGTPEDSFEAVAQRVILCTNGFERIRIKNNVGDDIDAKFHHMVNGDIGYMSAYLKKLDEPPTALSYHDQKGPDLETADSFDAIPYYYLTRRPYELENNETHNLITIGGPEELISETQDYDRQAAFSAGMGEKLDEFLKKTLKKEEKKDLEYKFQWHGIMCYTPSGMRVIGAEPKNTILMYNLGCNGVGIMSSIYGGSKIAKLVAGETFPPSVFDPKTE